VALHVRRQHGGPGGGLHRPHGTQRALDARREAIHRQGRRKHRRRGRLDQAERAPGGGADHAIG
jgi:hypothetical protein